MIKTYSELVDIPTFEGRIEYLRVGIPPSQLTFGLMRDLNQTFYRSVPWRNVRKIVISRDFGLDLGLPTYDIGGRIIVHHMNPLKPKDVLYHSNSALNPEYMITVSHRTHQAIHFGLPVGEMESFIERKSGDTKLW